MSALAVRRTDAALMRCGCLGMHYLTDAVFLAGPLTTNGAGRKALPTIDCSAARATYSGCLQSTSALNAAWVKRTHDLPCGTSEVAALTDE
jgi:hypothetical protein